MVDMVGFFVAIIVSRRRLTLLIADLVVELTRVIPPLIFIPFATLLLGSSYLVETLSVATYAALAMTLYTLNAIATVPPDFLALGRLLGAGQFRILMTIQIPAILPNLVGPLRVIISLGLGVAVVAEFLAAPGGIGRVMKFAISYARADLILVGVIWAILSVLALDIAVTCVSKMGLRWATSRRS